MCKLKNISATNPKDYGSMILRIVLGAVIFPHGAQKLFGMFGGNGYEGTMAFMTGSMGIPFIIAILVILGESIGAIALILGFFSRFMAFGIFLIVGGAMIMVHLQYGFFIDWFGTGTGNGVEYHLLAIGMAIAIMIKGGGAWSFDLVLDKCINKKK